MMIKRLSMVAAMGFTIGLPVAGTAAAQDTLRCEAAGLRYEARQIVCAARCEDRASYRIAGNGRAAASEEETAAVYAKMIRCEESCVNKHDLGIRRLANTPMCTAPAVVEPDPESCRAELLRAEARSLRCLSRCRHRADGWPEFDAAACEDRCSGRHEEGTDEIRETPECVGFGQAE